MTIHQGNDISMIVNHKGRRHSFYYQNLYTLSSSARKQSVAIFQKTTNHMQPNLCKSYMVPEAMWYHGHVAGPTVKFYG